MTNLDSFLCTETSDDFASDHLSLASLRGTFASEPAAEPIPDEFDLIADPVTF